MKELSLREIQLRELALLEKFDSFCEKNNIIYFLAGGTLIGAIRHKGFIPWDDDIDVAMPRPDYERFIALREKFSCEFPNAVVKTLNDENYPLPFAKIFDTDTQLIIPSLKPWNKHIWLDIFPFDGAYSSMNQNKKLYRKMRFYRFFLFFASFVPGKIGRTWFKRMAGYVIIYLSELFVKLFNPASILDKKARKLSYEDAEFVANTIDGDSFKNPIRKKEIFPLIKKEFEGKLFNVPSNYDTYLTQAYGDYMQLPPESKRSAHGIRAMASEITESCSSPIQ